jgi:hypothetical protein
VKLLLDALALAAVIAAVVHLWRGRGSSCASCAPRSHAAEARLSLTPLRATARRTGDRR